MSFARLVLAVPHHAAGEAKLHLLGLQAMLDQDGFKYSVRPVSEVHAGEAEVVLAADLQAYLPEELEAIATLAAHTPVVWVGVPLLPNLPQPFRAAFGFDRAVLDPTRNLRLCRFRPHAITRALERPEERLVRVKRAPVLVGYRHPEGEMVASLHLGDNRWMSAGLVALDGPPRRVVIPFGLGVLFVMRNCVHPDLRRDLDEFEYPVGSVIDVWRHVLGEALRWAAAPHTLVRVYPWPAQDGFIPNGVLALSHDLCGYLPEGREFIVRTCRKFDVKTTFFDGPTFKLQRGEDEGHVVALHVGDHTDLEELKRAKGELETIHGRAVVGWRRHGPSMPESYPDIWRRLAAAGIQWTSTFAVSSHPFLIVSEGMSTGNRLPYRLIDPVHGEWIGPLEIPSFESQDAERLSNIHYGPQLSDARFRNAVQRRLEFIEKHHLLAGYLIHGWTAGGKREEGRFHGARSARRMMRWITEQALARHFLVLDHQRLADWWHFRERIGLEAKGDTLFINLPGGEFSAVMDLGEGQDGVFWLNGKAERVQHPPSGSVRLVQLPARGGRYTLTLPA